MEAWYTEDVFVFWLTVEIAYAYYVLKTVLFGSCYCEFQVTVEVFIGVVEVVVAADQCNFYCVFSVSLAFCCFKSVYDDF